MTRASSLQTEFDKKLARMRTSVERLLVETTRDLTPRSLYDPLRYVLKGGGKRIRPALLMLSCEAVGGTLQGAIHAAAAIEILHNFTLVHDDIMDNAGSRRGRKTVHTKWDPNVAILVGDELLALAYRELLKTTSPRIKEIVQLFTQGVVEVCEGQALDKEFENRRRVTVEEYLGMIQRKTGKMIAISTEIGGLVGKGTEDELDALRTFGEFLGRAFQIHDDLLDIVGDERELGKDVGSDLQEGKKTFLFLEALRLAKGEDRKRLREVIANGGVSKKRIGAFRRIYESCGAIDSARESVRRDTERARAALAKLCPGESRDMLDWLTDVLLHRTY
ncbi:MAG: polyprenyl synthetase family protein [Ignavibacteria bacterium]|nr:polyprenyl synthetase family protein [Ignavibacteria bacterium]